MQPKSRYVKLNIVDWLLIATASILLLSLIGRGAAALMQEKEEAYMANVSFVIRDLDESTANLLSEQTAPFYLQDGRLLSDSYTVSVQPMTELLRDENGELTEVQSISSYKAIVSFVAKGQLAKDNTFLLSGMRRLSTGEALVLTQASVTYTADVLHVSPWAI